jgi:hypothetical protein
MLKRMAAEEQVAVCLVLHQPSTSIFSMLDHLLLLTNGTLVYSGAPGAAVELYQELRLQLRSDPSMNPADWLLDVAQGDVPNDRLQSSDPEQIMQDWRRHERTTPGGLLRERNLRRGRYTAAGRQGGRGGPCIPRSWLASVSCSGARAGMVLLVTVMVGLLAGLVRRLSLDELHNESQGKLAGGGCWSHHRTVTVTQQRACFVCSSGEQPPVHGSQPGLHGPERVVLWDGRPHARCVSWGRG